MDVRQRLLEVQDVCDVEKPDERSVMTYIASFFHAFSSMGACHLNLYLLFLIRRTDQAETVSRRVVKFAELMQSVWVSRNDYERRVKAVRFFSMFSPIIIQTFHQVLASLSEMQTHWSQSTFSGTYPDAKAHSASFVQYKQSKKREWVTEKQDLATLFGNVQTKLKTYGLREYVPENGLSPSVRTSLLLRSGTEPLMPGAGS